MFLFLFLYFSFKYNNIWVKKLRLDQVATLTNKYFDLKKKKTRVF